MMKKCLFTGAAALLVSFPAWAAQQPPRSDAVASEARVLLAKLVSYKSIAASRDVTEMANYLASEFRRAGFAEEDVELVQVGDRTGLLVRYRGSATTKAPVAFLSHMDVVDAKREEWSSDPWTLTEKDGALYGRGVVDNKYGLVTLAHAFMRLKREGFVPDRDLILAFTGDEEAGMQTTRALAERVNGAAFAINSDAGGGFRGTDGTATYAIQAAEKTYATFELTLRNPGGHSSRPRSDNAIYSLAGVLQRIEQHRFPTRWNDVTMESFRALVPTMNGEVKAALAAFVANPTPNLAEAVVKAEPGFDSEIRTTCVATMLRAGSVENALPTEATATVNCRIFPGETVDETKATLVRVAKDEAVEVKTLGDPAESPVSGVPDEARAALARVLEVRSPAATVAPYMEAGGTDGLHFRRSGTATVGMGPLFASENSNYNYHGIDERLPVDEFNEGLDHFYILIKALAGSAK